ncbi:PQQ-dependent sugar dehydrogenase [Hyphomonas sp.]|uniref:PQQ-dependent sugar dehydrogenase n=1 Tax=Hyphomonas sp. TaxID=87 RepID=UPI0035296176
MERPKQETNLMSFSGGGMTSFGNDLLLLPYDGIIYKARPDMSAQRTAIRAPDTHRDEFRALSETEAYKDYHFDLYYIRYNDLKYFEAGDQRGLLASYTEYHSDGECATNTLARLDFASSATTIDDVTAEPNDWEIVYRSSPCLKLKKRLSALEAHMAGGRMAITGPETVYLTNGDYHMDGMRSDGHGIAQDPENELGKVMRINYLTGESQIVSMGHRNMQGIAALPNGDVYVAEHGPQGGDELNLIREGANYGWPKESYGLTYSSGKLPESDSFGRHDTYTPPEFSWLPSPAISSMIYIKPSFHDAWTGDLLIGSLITESLWRVRFANGKPVYSEQIPIGSRIRSLWQHSNGQIVLWTDNHELIWLTARDIGGYAPVLDEYVKWHGISPATANRLAASVERCAECHSFQMAANSRSPSLARIYGERIASSSYAGYSDALRTKGGRWTDENLADFLTDPQSFSPGTTMPNVMEGDRATAEDVVKFLKYYNDKF